MMREFHDGVKVRVDISGEESNPFKVLAGVKLTSTPILSANVFRVYFYSFDVARDARIQIRLRYLSLYAYIKANVDAYRLAYLELERKLAYIHE